MTKKRLGGVLTDRSALSKEQLHEALGQQIHDAERLGESLVRNGLVSKTDIGAAIECVKGVAYLECPPKDIDPEVLALLPADVATRCCALPIRAEDKTLIVAMGEPQNLTLLEKLEFSSGMTIDPRFSFRNDVIEGIRKFYGGAGSSPEVTQPVVTGPTETAVSSVAVPCLPVRRQLSWLRRAAVVGGFAVAAIGGWSAGTAAQRAMSGFLVADARPDDGAFLSETPETLIDVREVRSTTTETSNVSSLEAVPPGPGTDPDTAGPETESRALESDLATAEPALPTTRPPQPVGPNAGFGSTIQVGTFGNRANAERLVDALSGKHEQVHMSVLPGDMYSVRMGPFFEKQIADRIAQEIQTDMNLSPLVLRTRLE